MSRTGSQLTIMQRGWPPRWPTSRGTSPARAADAGYAMEMAGLEPASPRCKRGALPVELHPQAMRTDGVEPPQRSAAALQAAELADAQRPQARATDRIRTGTSRFTTSGAGL